MEQVRIEEVQSFFFKAMLEGWASESGRTKTVVPKLHGFTGIPFSDGDFTLLDCYCTNPSGKSVGTTTIWFKDEPVWFMSYGGHYAKIVLPIVKEALRANYEEKLFMGGRGPGVYRGNFSYLGFPLIYTNIPRSNDFVRFDGSETVFAENGLAMGHHYYWGMSLTILREE